MFSRDGLACPASHNAYWARASSSLTQRVRNSFRSTQECQVRSANSQRVEARSLSLAVFTACSWPGRSEFNISDIDLSFHINKQVSFDNSHRMQRIAPQLSVCKGGHGPGLRGDD